MNPLPVGTPSDLRESMARCLLSGMSVATAGKALGIGADEALRLSESSACRDAVEQVRRGAERVRRFGRDMAHDLYMEAYAVASSLSDPSTMVKAVDSLVRLNGIALERNPAVQVHVAQQMGIGVPSGQGLVAADLAEASDEELHAIIEGEFEERTDGSSSSA